jgi:predicted DNA-binding transcriptional regulator AlpA
MRESDFIPLSELAELTGYSKKVFYHSHSYQRGPLHEILTKLGGRLGCWREDYEEWRDIQRRLRAKETA